MAWPANGETDWNTKMLAYLAIGHNTDGTHRGIIDVQDPTYGAGTGLADNSIAFNSAIDAAFAAGGGEVRIPSGTYIFTNPVVHENTSGIIEGITISGEGKAILDFSALSGSEKAISITGQDNSNRIETMLILENLKIKGPDTDASTGSPTTTTLGLEFSWIMDLQLKQVEVQTFHTNLWVDTCWPIRTDGCIFTDGYIGAQFDDDCTIGYHASQFDGNYHNLYLHNDVFNQTFISPLLQNAGGNAVVLDAPVGKKIWGITFINPYLEAIAGNAFNLCCELDDSESAGSVFDIQIIGGVWSAITGYPIHTLAAAGNVHSVTLLNCYGIDDIAADIHGKLRDSVMITGNTSTNGLMWFWNNTGDILTPVFTELLGAGVRLHNVNTIITDLTAVQVKALTTPIEIAPAPGANKYIEFISATLILDKGSEVFSETDDNLVVRYNDGSGVIVSEVIECTGFIDQGADTMTRAIPVKNAIVAASASVNKKLVIDNPNDNFAGNASNDAALRVVTTFRVHTSLSL